MPRATSNKARPVGRPSSGRFAVAKINAVKQRAAPKGPAPATSSSKEELRARVEKLERANATLRVKNKELRIVAVEAAEQLDALTVQLANTEKRVGRQLRHEAPAETMETREILRPNRVKRKAREAAADDDSDDDQHVSGETHGGWRSHDQAEA